MKLHLFRSRALLPIQVGRVRAWAKNAIPNTRQAPRGTTRRHLGRVVLPVSLLTLLLSCGLLADDRPLGDDLPVRVSIHVNCIDKDGPREGLLLHIGYAWGKSVGADILYPIDIVDQAFSNQDGFVEVTRDINVGTDAEYFLVGVNTKDIYTLDQIYKQYYRIYYREEILNAPTVSAGESGGEVYLLETYWASVPY